MEKKKTIYAIIVTIAMSLYVTFVVAIIKRRKKVFTYAETKTRCNWSYLIGVLFGAFYYWYADKEIKKAKKTGMWNDDSGDQIRKMFGLKNKDERFIARLEKLYYGCKIDEWSEFGRWIEKNTDWREEPEDGMKAGVCSGMVVFYNEKGGYYTV